MGLRVQEGTPSTGSTQSTGRDSEYSMNSDLGLPPEGGQTSGDAAASVDSVLVLQKRGGLHAVRDLRQQKAEA